MNTAGSPWSTCNAECGTTGTQDSTYTVTIPAAYGGASCPAATGDVRSQPCTGAECKKDCVGSWTTIAGCSATCGGGTETLKYVVVTAATGGGAACEAADGAVMTQSCNTDPCPTPKQPVDCVGDWVWGDCSATCGGGTQKGVFVVTSPAANGGKECSSPNQATNKVACNTQPCVDSSQLATITVQVRVQHLPVSSSVAAGCTKQHWVSLNSINSKSHCRIMSWNRHFCALLSHTL